MILDLAREMNWPFAFMGMAFFASFGIYLIVSRINRGLERQQEMRLEQEKLERMKVIEAKRPEVDREYD